MKGNIIDFSAHEMIRFSQNQVWVATFDGIVVLNAETLSFESRIEQKKAEASLSSNGVMSLYKTQSGDVWVGTNTSGANYYSPFYNIFDRYIDNPLLPDHFNPSDVTNVFAEGIGGKIFVGTSSAGLKVIDSQNRLEETLFPELNIRDLKFDQKGNLWIGTLEHGVVKYDTTSKKVIHFNMDEKSANYGMPHVIAKHVLLIDKEDVWVAAFNHLYLYDQKNNRFETFDFEYDLNNPYLKVNKIIKYNDDLWVITNSGIRVFDIQKKLFVKSYFHDDQDIYSIPHNNVTDAHQDLYGELWLATRAGLSRYITETDHFENITEKDGLPSDLVVCVIFDDNNNLWMSTSRGIAVMYSNTRKIDVFDKANNLQNDEFRVGACYKCKDNRLLFGGDYGFNVIRPSEVMTDTRRPKVILNNFYLFNKLITPSKDGILQKSIQKSDTIMLSYDQNIFSIEFSAINFSSSSSPKYAYILKGFEKDWNMAYTSNMATYANLAPGTYKFEVRAASAAGLWSEESTFIYVKVIPPFWQTIWFQVAGVIFALAFITIFCKIRVRAYKKNEKLLLERVEHRTSELHVSNDQLWMKNDKILLQQSKLEEQKERLEKALLNLKQTQSQLIASEKISSIGVLTGGLAHELNNPLNYLSGLSGHIKARLEALNANDTAEVGEFVKETIELLHTMQDGALKATGIVKNLLDISPRTLNKPSQVVDLGNMLLASVSLFEKSNENIRFDSHFDHELPFYGDITELNQAFVNIIKNSFEAIPANRTGVIEVTGVRKEEIVSISIADNGSGISSEDMGKIFEPFFTTKPPDSGAGLGLYISQSIIKKYGGDILVAQSSNEGTCFQITLPLDFEHHS